jgi:S-DNA-T family DNA segregation ATPase FtsK/SpoIIIE
MEDDEDDADEALPQAIKIAVESGQISTTLLQRKLRLGYSRAGRIMDQMEQRGIVGPSVGSKPREVLITRQQWIEMNMNEEG